MAFFLPEGAQPLPGDSRVRSLWKIVYMLGGSPSPGDDESDSLRKLAQLIFAGQQSSGAGGLVSGGGPSDNYRIVNGQVQIYNPDTGLFYPLNVNGQAGFETLTIGQGAS